MTGARLAAYHGSWELDVIFTLTELEHHPIEFDVTYAPGEIGFSDEIRQKGGLRAAGKAELLRNTLGEIRIKGHLTVELESGCDRCLEPAALPLDSDFDLFYRPVIRTSNHAEVHLEEGEIDLSFYEGDSLALRDALREHVLLSLPMQLTCSPDCKGLCPDCGGNLNTTPCACASKRADPRWSALKGLK